MSGGGATVLSAGQLKFLDNSIESAEQAQGPLAKVCEKVESIFNAADYPKDLGLDPIKFPDPLPKNGLAVLGSGKNCELRIGEVKGKARILDKMREYLDEALEGSGKGH